MESNYFFSDAVEEENDEVSQDEDQGLEDDEERHAKDVKEEVAEEENEAVIECTLTEEEKLEEVWLYSGL